MEAAATGQLQLMHTARVSHALLPPSQENSSAASGPLGQEGQDGDSRALRRAGRERGGSTGGPLLGRGSRAGRGEERETEKEMDQRGEAEGRGRG